VTRPLELPGTCNVVLGPRGRRGLSESGELAGGLGQGSGWGGSRVHEGSTWVLTCSGEVAGGHGRLGQAAAAAEAVAPARMWPGLGSKRRQARLQGLGKTLAWLDGWEKERTRELGVRGTHGAVVEARQERNARGWRAPAT
jgi:hypothetical protein